MKRVQVIGGLFSGKVPEGAVYVGRATPSLPGSPFANPFKVGEYPDPVRAFACHLDKHPELVERARRELAGKDLACWCKPGQPCHADELILRILASEADFNAGCAKAAADAYDRKRFT